MNKTVSAYIAGFFDGDGSIRLQLQPRENSINGFRVRAILSFAQKTGHGDELHWIRKQLKIGYIYRRNDGMDELKIEGFRQVGEILKQLQPFTRFKREQISLVLEALKLLSKEHYEILRVAEIADKVAGRNYVTRRRLYTAEYIKQFIKKQTPVTTDVR